MADHRPVATLAASAILLCCGNSEPPPTSLLASLAVAPLALNPAFSPAVHDYFVRCGAGENALTVSASAASGGTIALTRPKTTSAASSRVEQISLNENDAVVVSASRDGVTEEYWVRCLPADFPKLSMTTTGNPLPGYYAVGNEFFAKGETGYAMILDGEGTPVWYAPTKNGAGAKNVEVLDDNTISFAPRPGYTFGDDAGRFELHTLSPPRIDYVTTVGVPLDAHELRRLESGNFMLLGDPIRTGVDLTGVAGYAEYTSAIDCVIQEVTPAGKLVWQWDAMDHFDVAKECTYPLLQPATTLSGETTQVFDPFHCNSIDVATNGDLLVSARHLDAVFMVSRTTGKVLWKLGGSTFNKDGAPHVTVTGDSQGGFFRQHDARLQPNGTVSLFDDETARPNPARGLVLSYDLAAGTASIAWQYKGTGMVGAMGSLTILPDGSRVVGWGTGVPAFTEVGEAGQTLRALTFTDGDQSYRARKVPLATLDVDAMRQSVGAYVESDAGVPDGG